MRRRRWASSAFLLNLGRIWLIIPPVTEREHPADVPERREYGRIRLEQPLKGLFGTDEVRVLEVSVAGFRVAHQTPLEPETTRSLVLEWDGVRMEMDCRIIRTKLVRLAKLPGERSLYQSALQIVEYSGNARTELRNFIAERVIRALDEQKANARGVPPLAAYMHHQTKTGQLYRRCELIEGSWRKSETTLAAQPANGFTISAQVAPEYVEMLCQTWESSTEEGRRLARQLAELSIQTTEGIPTRRYDP
jgi:hypothetical protein